MSEERQPKAFISYSHEDKAFAHALYEELTKLGVQPWIDEVELFVGDSLIGKIGEAIADSDFVVPIVSCASISSAWCEKELSLATTQGINLRKVNVLPVRLDSTQMPPYLSDVVYLDAQTSDPTKVAQDLAIAMDRHLRPMTPEVQEAVSKPPVEPKVGTAGAWSGVPWRIGGGPYAAPRTGRDADGFAWEIERKGETRRVIVWISGSAVASAEGGLPPEVVQAKQSRGRSVVQSLTAMDDPPAEVLVATYGIRLEVPS